VTNLVNAMKRTWVFLNGSQRGKGSWKLPNAAEKLTPLEQYWWNHSNQYRRCYVTAKWAITVGMWWEVGWNHGYRTHARPFL